MIEYYFLGIIVLPAIILSIYAQIKVSRTYRIYSQIPSQSNVTASEFARQLLDQAGMQNVQIKEIGGEMTDYYDSHDKVLALSSNTYHSSSVAAIGVACHELGHALQDHQHYFPLKLRKASIVLGGVLNRLFMPLIIGGIVLMMLGMWFGVGLWFVAIGSFVVSTLICLVTLPVETNASRRAMKMINSSGILNASEAQGAKKVLDAAALTYVAALLVSIMQLLRIFLYMNRD